MASPIEIKHSDVLAADIWPRLHGLAGPGVGDVPVEPKSTEMAETELTTTSPVPTTDPSIFGVLIVDVLMCGGGGGEGEVNKEGFESDRRSGFEAARRSLYGRLFRPEMTSRCGGE
jgi:hypothetical protein